MPAIPLVRLTALAALASLLSVSAPEAQAQLSCQPLLQGLRGPLGLALGPRGDLLISETGSLAELRGRLSLMTRDGLRRTLLDGLPSGVSDVGGASGPAGLLLRGRTLYMALGVGDVAVGGPVRGTSLPNPAGPSSPLFSAVLALQFSTDVEQSGGGFMLQPGDDHRLAAGERLTLRNPAGERMQLRRVTDFPNSVPAPLPFLPGNVQNANPFQLAAQDEALFVSDGGRNLVWRVDLASGSNVALTAFPDIPNPAFPVGPPTQQAVPTGLGLQDSRLLVALFRGAPFVAGTSAIEQIDPATGSRQPLIGGLKQAIAVQPLAARWGGGLLVMQHSSVGLFFDGPGLLQHYPTPTDAPRLLANCLSLPTALAVDAKRGRVYVAEEGGRLVAVDLP